MEGGTYFMLSLFPKCRSYMLAGGTVTIALFALFVSRKQTFLGCIFLLLGFFASRFAAEYQALKAHQKLLSILYYAKNPEQFIQIYEPLITGAKIQDNIRFTLQTHLLNGYIACGSFEKALQILDNLPALSAGNEAYGKSLIAGNRCLIYCLQDDLEHAETYYNEFLSYGESITKKQSRSSYIESKATLNTRIKMLKGKSSKQDAYDLRERLKSQITPFQKVELQYLLGRVYLNLREYAFAQNCLKEAAQAGDQLYAARRAKEFLK